MNDDSMTFAEYRNEIESTAEIIIEEAAEYSDFPVTSDRFEMDVQEDIFETVDSHQWIIYNSYHTDILTHAENDPEEWDVFVEDGETDHRTVLCAMAFCAFRADVTDAVNDKLAEIREDAERTNSGPSGHHEVLPDDMDRVDERMAEDRDRKYSDGALRIFVGDLSDNELHGLKFGMLPAEPFGDFEPPLTGSDVARMMELAEEAR